MAKVELTMQSLGAEKSSCCEKTFERGETMHAVVADNGTPLGWYCSECIKTQKSRGEWKRGSFGDEPFARSCLSIFREDGHKVAEISREGFMAMEEAEANAQLIASAPKLHGACKIALGLLVALDTKATREVADICRQALLEAGGK